MAEKRGPRKLKQAEKKLKSLKDRATEPMERLDKLQKHFDELHEDGHLPAHNNEVAGLQKWHMELIRDRIIDNTEYTELAEKYGCTREWASVICRSDVGIAYAKEIIDKFDIQAVRKTFQILTSPATRVLSKVITGHNDGIDELDRAKLCLDVIKAGGIAAPKEHKFKFEHIFKEAGDRLEENERLLLAGGATAKATSQVIEAEIVEAALKEDDDG